ncbi:hypothetical protein PPACK8108_LOCUS9753 [Phakopsora pachyrhizi]|uniref:Uncharacterized protein n=1 Tax=Phakopsora pachyrhizi TaxID=170000 RepID=A0AAV0AYZ8_PHAPC|nr:hypothetical protein PPACK8108_LOCUS9753 [Phakopsora pachyrhizi]
MANLTMLLDIFHNIVDFQLPHGYPRIYPEYQIPYDTNPSRSTLQSSYKQDNAKNDLKLFQKLMPSASWEAIIIVD